MEDIDRVYRQIAQIAEREGAQRVILFGSRARGTNLPKSDIDIAVEGCPHPEAFEDAVQNDLWSLLMVDVVNLDETVSPALRAEIERDGRVLYEKAR